MFGCVGRLFLLSRQSSTDFDQIQRLRLRCWMETQPKEFTREQVYEILWKKGAKHVADTTGVTGVDILKICRKFDIPKPGSGYWRQVALGKAPERPALPSAPRNTPSVILIPQPKKESTVITSKAVEARASRPNTCKIRVADDFQKAHPLIRQARAVLKYPDQYNRLRSGYRQSCVNVRVSKESLNRALLILDALANALGDLGHTLVLGTGIEGTFFKIGDVDVRVAISEKVDRRNRNDSDPLRQYDWVPNGRLMFSIDEFLEGDRKTWTESAKRPLEFSLDEIFNSIIRAAETLRVQRLKNQEEARRSAENQLREQEVERQKLHEGQRKKQVDQLAADLAKSRQVEEFVTACEKELLKIGPLIEGSPAAKWIAWAKEYARSIDPLSSGSLAQIEQAQREFLKSAGSDSPSV